MNQITIAGHLGSDPVTRYTPGGQKVTSFRVATNSKKAGKEETTWWQITIWGDRFDRLLTFLKKGSAVLVTGKLKPEIYTNREGRSQISLEVTAEIIELSPFGRTTGERQGGAGAGSQASYAPSQAYAAKGSPSSPRYEGGSHDAEFQGAGFPGHEVPEEDFAEEEMPF